MPTQVDRGLAIAIPLTVLFASFLAASPARADEDEGFDKKPDDLIAADKQARDEKSAKMPGEKDKAPPAADAPDPKFDPTEETSKPYRFIGARFRDVIVPKFMINIFADGGATVNVPMGGIEFATRKDHFMFVFGLQYADYSMKPFLFKGHGQSDEAYEMVSSSLKQVMFTADLLYEVPLDKKSSRYAFLIGGGVGIGGVFGSLYRSQAYPASGNTADPNVPTQWRQCSGPAPSPVTSTGAAYCDVKNSHYNDGHTNGGKGYAEPSWAHGGSKPLVFPWIALPQLGFRWKPIKQFETRLDLGFSTSGFFFGLAASYGL